MLKREWKIKDDGYTIDLGDNRPFSTNFAFSRFLVPHYAKYLGTKITDPCVFVDSDFVFLTDIYKVLNEIDVDTAPVHCVKHDYQSASLVKMDNQTQVNYNKKLWSSFMIFNMAHPKSCPTVEEVNTKDGQWLHSFGWLGKDSEIGSIGESWNYIPDHSKIKTRDIKAIHYTEGTPLMIPECKLSEVFNSYLREVLDSARDNPKILGEI